MPHDFSNPSEWKEKYGDVDPYETDDKPAPSEYDGELHEDGSGNNYNPWAGSQSPSPGRCNALLTDYQERYGEKRFCTKLPHACFTDAEHPFCKTHASRKDLQMRARELFDTGLHCKTIHHFYDKLDPLKQVFAWALYDRLIHDSEFDYEPEYVQETFDFDRDDYDGHVPDECEDGTLQLEVPDPSSYHDQATALWLAALDAVKMLRCNVVLADKNMQSTTTEHADLVVPEDGSPYHVSIEEMTEHHLNLPYSRLVRDRKELLEHGGVGIDVEGGEEQPVARMEYFESPLDEEPAVDPEAIEGDVPTPVSE